MPSVEDRLAAIEDTLKTVNRELGVLIGQQKTTTTLVKFVILPLIVIVGGLVGLKIM